MPRIQPLRHYHYDPLDRLVGCTAPGAPQALRFYQHERQVTEIEGPLRRSIFQQADTLLAEQRHDGMSAETMLLAVDQQRSVIRAGVQPLVYSPYGFCAASNGLVSLLGFNGERVDPVTGHYLLGNGYRAFNPVLMRFNSPDSWSPFGMGGLNAYSYCKGQPLLHVDPTGRSPVGKVLAKSKSLVFSMLGKIDDDITMFEQHTRYGKNLVVQAHSRELENGTAVVVNRAEKNVSAVELVGKINAVTDVKSYSKARLVVCNSADGGPRSFAQMFANESGLETKGYVGGVISTDGHGFASQLAMGEVSERKIDFSIIKIRGLFEGDYMGVSSKAVRFNPGS